MLALIKKDLLLMKNNLKLIGIMLIIFFFMAMQGTYDLAFLPVMICIMIFMSTFSYDEYNKWDAYAITMPNGRKNIVKSKYIATLILVGISIIITLVLNITIGYINKNLDLEQIISIMSGYLLAIIIIESILYPIIFKFGIEKGRIGLFIAVFGIVSIISGLSKVLNVETPINFINFIEKYWFIIIPIISIIFLIISYKISERIYLKKEF